MSRNPILLVGRLDSWTTEPRNMLDVALCVVGRHRVYTRAADEGMIIDRCSCGAVRINDRTWFDAHPFLRRKAAT